MKFWICSAHLFVLFLTISSASAQQKTDWKEDNLKGMVMGINEISYAVTNGDTFHRKPHSFAFRIFNRRGFLLHDSAGIYDWGMDDRYDYFYDGDRLLKEETYSKGQTRPSIDMYRYDSLGNRSFKLKYYRDSTSDGGERYLYDSHRRMTVLEDYNGKGQLEWRYVYRYDSALRQTTREQYKPDGTLFFYVVTSYDTAGRELKVKAYGADHHFSYGTKYIYDDGGNQVESDNCNEQEQVTDAFKTKYIYDSVGNWILKEEFNKAGILVQFYRRTYRYF